ncbi:hypothetical protein PISMIDRAFT_687975 [Pisolithus microcarpus 441]|uniref:Uncharacterized protein n=1 Tax=Pisolithus microcarpus 441 TaxID=765257 RepID=A0A0C9XQE8_9AGAM|nr:hypothetical protein PISMIDRAFT_687975 [Pisolithus microcarpus 441]
MSNPMSNSQISELSHVSSHPYMPNAQSRTAVFLHQCYDANIISTRSNEKATNDNSILSNMHQYAI